jgi:hypothetical protein
MTSLFNQGAESDRVSKRERKVGAKAKTQRAKNTKRKFHESNKTSRRHKSLKSID